MKNTLFYHKILFCWIFLLAMLVIACQEEEDIEIVNNGEEPVAINSNLAMLLLDIAANDGSVDDLLDNANCFEVNLPVVVSINGVTITIATLDDLALLEEIINESDLDDDILEFKFPIIITLNDYTEIEINSQDDILAFINECFNQTTSITNCINIQYPISFSVFNTDFDVIDTVTIASDEALYLFLESLVNGSNGTIVANLNYPITLIYENGEIIEVTTNQELEEAILNAANNCEIVETSCEEEVLDALLQECFWEITSYNNTTDFSEYLFNFKQSDSLQITNNLSLIEGQWTTTEEENGTTLTLSNLGILEDDLGGEWLIEECMSEVLNLVQGDTTITLAQNCEEEPVPPCFEDAELIVCDQENTGFGIFDLTEATQSCDNTDVYSITYHETFIDAETGTNPIPNPEAYTSITNPQTIYYRVALIENANAFEIYEIQLFSEFCCENTGVLLEDLVIYIPFSSETVDLISGIHLQGYNGQFVEDRSGNPSCAYSFTDNGDLLFMPVTAQNQIVQGDSFSISLWFKMQNEDPGDFERLFQKGIQLDEGFQLAVFDLNTPLFSDSTLSYGLWDTDWNQEVDVVWTNTDWHHLVVTVDQSNTVRLYRDGELRAIDENSNIDIGSNPLSFFALGHELTGHLDDLRVYKRTLNPTEIDELYNLEGDCFTCL